MHFSSPSGQRFSWWRPWKRGAVGFFSNGYCSVTTFLNMVRNVTPKPAMGSQNCSLALLEPELVLSATYLLLSGHRGHGVAAGEGVELRPLAGCATTGRDVLGLFRLRDEAEDD